MEAKTYNSDGGRALICAAMYFKCTLMYFKTTMHPNNAPCLNVLRVKLHKWFKNTENRTFLDINYVIDFSSVVFKASASALNIKIEKLL